MSGGGFDYLHEHAGTLDALAARRSTVQSVGDYLVALDVLGYGDTDRAGRDTLELARLLRRWERHAVAHAAPLLAVWRVADRVESGDAGEAELRAATAGYAARQVSPGRRPVDDPAGYLRDALATHERSERDRRTLHPGAPDIELTYRHGAMEWATEDGQVLTAEWWEQHSDSAADPFVLALIASMRDLLDDYDQDAALLKTLDPAGEAYGMTVKGQAVRAGIIRQWAAAYAARQEG
ncbi:hypothetical protein [Streptomyces sp. CCM_MD2014]|uniref:hypothetical protein n=1 Tax=Streptomyces sp. CCM_MD2014 TaxID=1561022 RepID=UPI00052AE4EB|nr:hypothetical protein [Streptomyces sp. CCM_MD2014]AIV35601.1 hypothetical protein NI25_20605 [Streptomyces sp. CCM_MD2014]